MVERRIYDRSHSPFIITFPSSSPSPPETNAITPSSTNGTIETPPSKGGLPPSPSPSNITFPSPSPSPPETNAITPPSTNGTIESPPSKGGLPPVTMTGIIVGVVLGAIFVMVGAGILVIIWRRRTREKGEGLSGGRAAEKPTEAPAIDFGVPKMKAFTYEELAEATNGFLVSNLLGQGGFGDVYKGILDGMEVAIKKLKPGSRQGEHEFQQEVKIISRVHHRHLVSLIGYCIADAHRMLVYEFVSNKTLEFHLHGKAGAAMDWATRVKIAIGTAKGLAYLHEGCHPAIIHRDVKGANILLNDNFEAKVADFGLAKTFLDIETHVSTGVKGTFGYIDPEYASAWKLTDKSDVYSFGVVLLELITGHRPIDKNKLFLDDGIVYWANPLLGQALKDGIYDNLVDPKLHKCYNYTEMARMIACAAASLCHSAKRPRMSQIVGALEGNIYSNVQTEGVTPGQSTFFLMLAQINTKKIRRISGRWYWRDKSGVVVDPVSRLVSMVSKHQATALKANKLATQEMELKEMVEQTKEIR